MVGAKNYAAANTYYTKALHLNPNSPLILLDIAGTGVASYMLEAWWLVGAMALALVGWIVHLAADPAPRRVAAHA